jgi:hypothetical protein
METVRSSEMSVDFYQTMWLHISDGSTSYVCILSWSEKFEDAH